MSTPVTHRHRPVEQRGAPPGRRLLAIPLVAALVVVLLPLFAAPAAAAPTTDMDVTLSLDWFERFEVPDDGVDEEGEFFPEVFIGGGAGQRGRIVTDDRFDPSAIPNPWVFTRRVSLAEGVTTIPVVIRIFDDDGGTNFAVDRMDVSPRNQDIELNLDYDVLTGAWTGDDVPPAAPCRDRDGGLHGQTCAIGDGDPNFPESGDGKRVTLGFSMTVPDLPDIDGDGIPDLVEIAGVRERDGAVVADLRALGADPCRKSVVVVIDWMTGNADGHDHRPKDAAITAVKDTFDAAPVAAVTPCPYAGAHEPSGIDFVHVPGRGIPEQAQISLNSPQYRNARTAGLSTALAPYAHYALMAHDRVEAPGSSGQCCEPTRGNNKDVIVSLGSWRTFCVGDFGREFGGDGVLQTTAAGDDTTTGTVIEVGTDRTCDTTSADPTDRQVLTPGTGADDARVGTVADQAGTIIHELGHALNLDHGGNVGDQWKPNYVSVMNYFFQSGIPQGPPPLLINQMRDWRIGNTRFDLSDGRLPALDEAAGLDENVGIADGTDHTFWWTPNPDPTRAQRLLHSGPGNTALNWDDDRDAAGAPFLDPTPVTLDVNASGTQTRLTDHDDWSALRYRAVRSPDATGPAISGWGAGARPDEELTFLQALHQDLAFFGAYDPDVVLTKTVATPDAEAGAVLDYTVRAENAGTGAAAAVTVTDTLPDGTVVTRTRPHLDAGAAATEAFAHPVPCTTPDGTVLTNTATVAATDVAGGAEADTSDNTASAAATVHAPHPAVTATASGSVVAGEAVTTDVVVTNSGSGAATEVALTAVLPPDVYYSTALDLGAGPRPASVTRNPDGTTTLVWALGPLAGGATATVQYTARPSLLTAPGTTVTAAYSVAFRTAHCTFEPVTATAATGVTEVPATLDPLSAGFWKTHPEARTPELLARVQATDHRFDADGDGALSATEATAVLSAGGGQPDPARTQLLAVLLDTAERRVNGGTALDSALSRRLGTATVADAVRYAFATLALPVDRSTADRYADATTLLDQIANGRAIR